MLRLPVLRAHSYQRCVAATYGIAKESLKSFAVLFPAVGVTRHRAHPSRPSGFLRAMSAGTIYNCDQSGIVLRWAIKGKEALVGNPGRPRRSVSWHRVEQSELPHQSPPRRSR